MGKIYIVCPECRRQLSFNEVPGYQNMVVECPKCHFKANVSVYQSGGNARGGHGNDETATLLVAPPSRPLTPGQICVKNTGDIHRLKVGQNVIGRRAKSGDADIQIAGDMYMSRRHVIIDVVKKENGYEHRLVEINSKNIVKLNGNAINRGDILLLRFGDRLTLGSTDICIEACDDEATFLQ